MRQLILGDRVMTEKLALYQPSPILLSEIFAKRADMEQSVCKVDWCTEKVSKLGYCNRHYLQMYRHGKILDIKRSKFSPQEFIFSRGKCKIPLYDCTGNIVDIAVIDAEDYDKVKNCKFSYMGNYVRSTPKQQDFIFLHQIIMQSKWIDHIDGDPLNNRKRNLRLCNNQQNQCNQKPQVGRTSKYKGVYWQKSRNKFVSCIYPNNGKITLGSFINEKEAARAYNQAALKYYGEFARLNVIED